MLDLLVESFGELRFEPTEKRVRALIGEHPVVDSTRAVLVWEPRHVVPAYAVPAEDVSGELVPADSRPAVEGALHPGVPFADSHSSNGEAASVRVGGETRESAAFRLAEPDLAGYVLLDFRAFDAWYEEDEPIVGHPRDPFHRVDTRLSSRNVRVELDGELLAETSRPTLLFETGLPTRVYMPREDVRLELHPSDRRTYCAYKGEASYWSPEVNGERREALAWSYEHPLPDAVAIAGLIAFFNERADIVIDGERHERPRTQWSQP